MPTLYLVYKGNVMDQITGADPHKLEEMIKTALLVEKTAYDENIMLDVLQTAGNLIKEEKFAEAEKILIDGSTYEQWMEKFGAEITTGLAYCQLMLH